MTGPCLLGALPASLVVLCLGPMVLVQVYGMGLNMMKNMREPPEMTFYCHMQFIGETKFSLEVVSITWLAF